MKKTLLLLFIGLFGLALKAQAPVITGDLLLCPESNGTAYIVNDTPYDSYQWYWKYWFTSDPFVPIPGATGPSFTYDWQTYDQALLKVVATIDGQSFESNTIQIDSYAWVGLTVGLEDTPNISINPENGNVMLCAGTAFSMQVFMPYTIVQWYRNGDTISGATQTELHVNEAGVYHVVAAPGFCPDSTSPSLPIVVEINDDCALGTGDATSALWRVYPNPVSDQIHFNSRTPIESLSVFDITGQRVMSFAPKADSGTLNFSWLASGVYILEAQSGTGVDRIKIVKD